MLSDIKSKKHKRVYQSKGRMRYGSKSYSNPFFDDKKKNKKSISNPFSLKAKIFIFLFIVLIFGILWFLFYSNFFKIKNITASGGGKISPSEIEKISWDEADNNFFVLFPKRNIILFNTKNVSERLNEKYSFNELTISKKFPNQINISYNEKKYAFVWKEDDKLYFAGIGGEVISETVEEEIFGKNYPLIENLSDVKISNRQISIDHSYIDFAILAFSKLKNYSDEFKVSKLILDNEVNTVKIQLIDGPTVYFNTERSVDEQVDKLRIIKNEKIKDDFAHKIYIDLRVGNSVYYR